MNQNIILHHYLDFPCNTCCVIANRTIINEYNELLIEYNEMKERIKRYNTSLMVNCCFLMCIILGRVRCPKRICRPKSCKENKIVFDYNEISVYF